MKYKNLLLNLLSILYLEFLFGLLTIDVYSRSSIVNIVIFSLIVSTIITILNNKIIAYITYGILGFYFSMQFILKKVFGFYFSFNLFKLTDQVLKFGNETIISILKNIYAIVLFFLPLIFLIIYRRKIVKETNVLKYICILLVSICLFVLDIKLQKNDENSIYYLYTSINDTSLNNEKLGIINSGILDLHRTIFGFKEKIEPVISIDESDDIFEYKDNKLNIDFKNLRTNNSEIASLNNYMDSISPTKQNKYTGIFKGKNLIYIVAESFNEIGVREDLTPTLYKLVNSGFKFNNYYSSNNLSTIGGEFQALTGLYADSRFYILGEGA